jgi:hypothetical protein
MPSKSVTSSLLHERLKPEQRLLLATLNLPHSYQLSKKGEFLLMREFEYDLLKSQSNEEKHGIYFEVAQKLWSEPEAIN